MIYSVPWRSSSDGTGGAQRGIYYGVASGIYDRTMLRYSAVLAGLLVLGAGLRLVGVHSGLWADEGASWEQTGGDNLATVFAKLANDPSDRAQPLYFVLLHYWRALFGDGEASLRVPSILATIAAIPVVAETARKLFGIGAGVWAGATVTCSSYAIFYGDDIRPYGLLMLATASVLHAWATDRVGTVPRIGPQLRLVASAAILCVGSIFSVIPLVTIALADQRLRGETQRWFRLWAPGAAVCVPIFLICYWSFLLGGGLVHVTSPKSQGWLVSILFAVYGLIIGESFGPSVEALHAADRWPLLVSYGPRLLMVAVVLGILIVHLLLRCRSEKGRIAELTVMFTGGLLLGATAGYVANLNWLPRHAFYLAPILAVLTGSLVRPGAPRVIVAAVLLVMAMNAVSFFNDQFVPEYGRDDYRGVAAYLKSADAEGTAPLMVFGSVALLRDFYHVPRLIDGLGVRPRDMGCAISVVTHGAPKVIVVVGRPSYWDQNGQIELHNRYKLTSVLHFRYFDLYKLSRSSTAPACGA